MSNKVYYGKHIPTGEDWLILGINKKQDQVCVAGWPATMAKLSDIENLEEQRDIDEKELEYRNAEFGTNWD